MKKRPFVMVVPPLSLTLMLLLLTSRDCQGRFFSLVGNVPLQCTDSRFKRFDLSARATLQASSLMGERCEQAATFREVRSATVVRLVCSLSNPSGFLKQSTFSMSSPVKVTRCLDKPTISSRHAACTGASATVYRCVFSLIQGACRMHSAPHVQVVLCLLLRVSCSSRSLAR